MLNKSKNVTREKKKESNMKGVLFLLLHNMKGKERKKKKKVQQGYLVVIQSYIC